METVYRKTPMARREALAYCRRCLAVMLCCVLVFGLTIPAAPRARAEAATAVLAVGSGAFAANPVGGAIGLVCLAVAGLDIGAGYVHAEDSVFYGTRGYNIGAECWDYLYNLGGDVVGPWCADVYAHFTAKGGVAPGDTFEIPPEVAAAIQQWTVKNIEFTDGIVSYDDFVIFNKYDAFVLTTVDETGLASDPVKYSSAAKVLQFGSLVPAPLLPAGVDLTQDYLETFDLTEDFYYDFSWTSSCSDTSFGGRLKSYLYFHGVSVNLLDGLLSRYTSYDALETSVASSAAEQRNSSAGCLVYSPMYNRYYLGKVVFKDGVFYSDRRKYYNPTEAVPAPTSIPTTITKTPALDEAPTAPLEVTIPATLPTSEVGGYVVPVVDTLTGEDVLNPGKEDDLPKPDATAEVWQKLKEWLEQWGQGNRDLIDGKLDQIPGAIEDGINKTLPGAVDQALNDALPGALDNALADALPATGSALGDQTVNEVMNEPDSLGAVIVSKFPFSIPWDVVKAISLLAAPPVTPHWEIDFFSAMDGFNGFHARGDTAIVVDFERFEFLGQLCRWTSTLCFIYALALGTKRLIWTA